MSHNSALNDYLRPNQLFLSKAHAIPNNDNCSYKFNIGSIRCDKHSALYLSLLRYKFDYFKLSPAIKFIELFNYLNLYEEPIGISFEFFSFIISSNITVHKVSIVIKSIIELYALPYIIVSLVNRTLLSQQSEATRWNATLDKSLLGYDWGIEEFVFVASTDVDLTGTIYCYPKQADQSLPTWMSNISHAVTIKTNTDYRIFLNIDNNLNTIDENIEQTFGLSFGPELGKCATKILEMPGQWYIDNRNDSYKHNTFKDWLNFNHNTELKESELETMCGNEVLVPNSERLLTLYTDILQLAYCQNNLLSRNSIFADIDKVDDTIFLNKIPTTSFPRLNKMPIWNLIPLGIEVRQALFPKDVKDLTVNKMNQKRWHETATANGLTRFNIEDTIHNNFNSGSYSGYGSRDTCGGVSIKAFEPDPDVSGFAVCMPSVYRWEPSKNIDPELPILTDETVYSHSSTITQKQNTIFERLTIPVRQKVASYKSMAVYSKLLDLNEIKTYYMHADFNNISWPITRFINRMQNFSPITDPALTQQPNIIEKTSLLQSLDMKIDDDLLQTHCWLFEKFPNLTYLTEDSVGDERLGYMEFCASTPSYLGIHIVDDKVRPSIPNIPRIGRIAKVDEPLDDEGNVLANPSYNPAINYRNYMGVPDWSTCDFFNIANSYSLFKPIMEKSTLLEAKGTDDTINSEVKLLIGGVNQLNLLAHDTYDNEIVLKPPTRQRDWWGPANKGEDFVTNKSVSRLVTLDYGFAPLTNLTDNQFTLTVPTLRMYNNSSSNIWTENLLTNYFENAPATLPRGRTHRHGGSISQNQTSRNTLRLTNRIFNHISYNQAYISLPQLGVYDDNWAITNTVFMNTKTSGENKGLELCERLVAESLDSSEWPDDSGIPADLPNYKKRYVFETASGALSSSQTSFIKPFETDNNVYIWNMAYPFSPTSNIDLNPNKLSFQLWTERVFNSLPELKPFYDDNKLHNDIMPTQFINKEIPCFNTGQRYSSLFGNGYYDINYSTFLDQIPNVTDVVFVHIWCASAPYNVASCSISNIDSGRNPYDRAIPDIRCTKTAAQLLAPGLDPAQELVFIDDTNTYVNKAFTEGDRYHLHTYANSPLPQAAPINLSDMSAAYDRVASKVISADSKTLSVSTCGQFSNVFALRAYNSGQENDNPFALFEREVGCFPAYITCFELANTTCNLQLNVYGEHERSVQLNPYLDENYNAPADIQIESVASDSLAILHPRASQFLEFQKHPSKFADFRWASKHKNSPNIICSPNELMPGDLDDYDSIYKIKSDLTGTDNEVYSSEKISGDLRGIMPQLFYFPKSDMRYHYAEAEEFDDGGDIKHIMNCELKTHKILYPILSTLLNENENKPKQFLRQINIMCDEAMGDISERKKILATFTLQISSSEISSSNDSNYDPVMQFLVKTHMWLANATDIQIVTPLYTPLQANLHDGGLTELNIWFEFADTKTKLTHSEINNFGLEAVITSLPIARNVNTYGRNTNVNFGPASYIRQ